MKTNKIKLGWRITEAKDYLTIVQCYNCCGIGHTAKKCTITTTCMYCAGNHNSRECENQDLHPGCILCYIDNDKTGDRKRNPQHYCNEKNCELIKEIKQKIINSINYDE